ncbi:fungal-specific transcription factor domain-containing protein [Amylocarpus encephaloides]|uniref:Fungal-specific transcription factor domain-containing protein n=1 Tax=Amylocarpus encephaloides TaxID=45428 RepID=A0A9P8C967_9HELO|nr:fungal-specific transcription factor domain-containing protein [Amylocarpus encephaloides]
MPRPKKDGDPKPKKRSRTGCCYLLRPCKSRKVKCDEKRPICDNCQKQGESCDYSIRLNWESRGKNKDARQGLAGGRHRSFESHTWPAAQISGLGRYVQESPHNPSVGSQDDAHNSEATGYASGALNTIPQILATNMIDPSLTQKDVLVAGSWTINPSMFRPDYQFVQCYERSQPQVQSTDQRVQPPAVTKLRNVSNQGDDAPSPTASEIQYPSASTFSNRSLTVPNMDSPIVTPPNYGTRGITEIPECIKYDQPLKRFRYDNNPDLDHPNMPPPTLTSAAQANLALPMSSSPFPNSNSHALLQSAGGPRMKAIHPVAVGPPVLRRLSVNFLLSDTPAPPAPRSNSANHNSEGEHEDLYRDTYTWGVDRGFKDRDTDKNDDTNAISGSSPTALRDHLDLDIDESGKITHIEFGFGMETNHTAFDKSSYYDKPVPICIPKALEPLPATLLENPMNLLHHFLNHTAGCLIPHNCSSNPFKQILPRMAVHDNNLLSLLLAYSASHRARLLRQPEPATRIALWVQDIFPSLRKALDDPNKIITNANLATAIMLASLEIISPKAFGVAVPWQKHLDTARQIIAARGGPRGMQTASRKDKVASFLWSWFAYLDVLGSLSGPSSFSSDWILNYEIDGEDDYHIDCILGFTSRCVRILAKIADLARICDSQRIGPDLSIRANWEPSKEIVKVAQDLETSLSQSRLHPSQPCTHMQSSGEAAYHWDSLEMTATNEAFHWAGLVHIHRRILGKSSVHPDVQNAVREIHGALFKVRRGSSAEACLLFPMFTAGCDTQDEKQRADILERVKLAERVGMTQVHKARTLMERAWETGRPWETQTDWSWYLSEGDKRDSKRGLQTATLLRSQHLVLDLGAIDPVVNAARGDGVGNYSNTKIEALGARCRSGSTTPSHDLYKSLGADKICDLQDSREVPRTENRKSTELMFVGRRFGDRRLLSYRANLGWYGGKAAMSGCYRNYVDDA